MPRLPGVSSNAVARDSLEPLRHMSEAEAKAAIGSLLGELESASGSSAGPAEIRISRGEDGRAQLSLARSKLRGKDEAALGRQALRILLERAGLKGARLSQLPDLPTRRSEMESLLKQYLRSTPEVEATTRTSAIKPAGRVTHPVAMMAVGQTKAPWLATAVRKALKGMASDNPQERLEAKEQFMRDLARVPAELGEIDDFMAACLLMRAIDAVPFPKGGGAHSRETLLLDVLPAAVKLRWLAAIDAGEFPGDQMGIRELIARHIGGALGALDNAVEEDAGTTAEISGLAKTLDSMPAERRSLYQDLHEHEVEPLAAVLQSSRKAALQEMKRPSASPRQVAEHIVSHLDEPQTQALAVAVVGRAPSTLKALSPEEHELHQEMAQVLINRPPGRVANGQIASFKRVMSWEEPSEPAQASAPASKQASTPASKQASTQASVRTVTRTSTPAFTPGPTPEPAPEPAQPRGSLGRLAGMVRNVLGQPSSAAVGSVQARPLNEALGRLAATKLAEQTWIVAREALSPWRGSAASVGVSTHEASATRSTSSVKGDRAPVLAGDGHVLLTQIRATAGDRRGLESIAPPDKRDRLPALWHADVAADLARLPSLSSRPDIQRIREDFRARTEADTRLIAAAEKWLSTPRTARVGNMPNPVTLAEAYYRQMTTLTQAVRNRPLQGWMGLPGDQVNVVLLSMVVALARFHRLAQTEFNLSEPGESSPRPVAITRRSANTAAGKAAAEADMRNSPEVRFLLATLDESDPVIEALHRSAVESLEGA